MEVTDRVHIVAQGWEVARVVEPIYDLKADKVVMLFGEGVLPDGIPEFEREMLDDLEAAERIELEIREADLYDLDSAVQAFSQAVKDHEDDDVYINVSTGSQIASIAGMMAAQTADATPFYVRSSTADLDAEEVWTPEEPVFPDSGEITELPVFELQGPTEEQLRMLAYLYGEDGATKKELITFAQREELPFIASTEAKSDEGLYRLLESHIIDPLTEGEYVRVEKAGRKKEVYLEQRGIDALAAFPLEDETVETVESGVDTPEKFLEKWKSQSRYEAISVNLQDGENQWRPFADSQYDSEE
ncbi:DUF6293 family protein [Haloarcula salinisoli]|uniref:Uncharacterized protein n=1 Tax=Haloarcula salinisoli TaxID=2487746 RepID=A0A8J7YA91_9EURY|nr:DUF6293 family protein [Halomicroarcula salinisoli]MBX0286257.1 hypothetical protein [Halomicroarcula salinisoli]MBX0302255.1 hypothetical protein [Halomicroarcula salinisoli]